MPWSNQNGGGSGGGGWQGGGNRGPWGQGPRGGGPGGGNQPPDLDDLIRKGKEKIGEIFGGSGGPGAGASGSRGIAVIAGIAVLALVGWSSVFRVDTDQQGIVIRFGDFVRAAPPGLHLKLPYPIETVELPTVTRIKRVDIGMRDTTGGALSVPEESLMLTGDENIVDIDFSVYWRIKDAPDYLFNVQYPDQTVKAIAESAMREAVGEAKIDVLQTSGRNEAQNKVRELMQAALDSYKSGILITEVKLQKVDPPSEVIDAFRDVQAARADQERLQNEAQSYANTVVPKARGNVSQIAQAAQAYKARVVAEAEGESKRFLAVFEQYKKAKDVTRERLYLGTMEQVLAGTNKIIIDQPDGKGVLPYLPLDSLKPQPKKPVVDVNATPDLPTSNNGTPRP